MAGDNICIFPSAPGPTAGASMSRRSPQEVEKAALKYFLMEPLIQDLASLARMSECAALVMLNDDDGVNAEDLNRAFRNIRAEAEALSKFYQHKGIGDD